MASGRIHLLHAQVIHASVGRNHDPQFGIGGNHAKIPFLRLSAGFKRIGQSVIGQVTSFGLRYHERMKSRVVSATEFKAKCLALLDEVGNQGGTITVTKRGRPMATEGPARKQLWPSSEGLWKGKVHIPEERLTADMSDRWEVLRQE